jgi:hypothetical protein
MSYGTTFDDFEWEADLELKDNSKLWTIDWKTKDKAKQKEVLKWLNDDWADKFSAAQPRIRTYRENLALYKGIHYRSQETRTQDFRRDAGDRSIRNPKIVVNHIYDMVESRVAKFNRKRPSIAVLPNTSEWDDRVNSKLGEKLLKHLWRQQDFDGVMRDNDRMTDIFGNGYVKVHFNKNAGPIHPLYKKAKEMGVEIDKLDKSGEAITTEKGERVKLKEWVKIGEIEYEILDPAKIFPEKKDKWEDVDHVTEITYVNIDELKAMYPNKEKDIKKRTGTRFDPEGMEEVNLRNEVPVRILWHKQTRFLPQGAKIVYTEDAILEVDDLPFKHGCLPFLRMSDIDVPTELHGRSFISVIKQLQRHYNNLASGVARNHGLASAPKWVMPAGAAKISSLNNEVTIIEYKGGVPPTLQSMNPTGVEIFNYMEKLEQNIEKLSGVHGISRGTPPPGIRAGVALQFLDEQEAERENNRVAKRNRFIIDIAKMTLSLMSQYYKKEDGRLLKIVGKDNEYAVESFEVADFDNGYDVQILNSSALPDSKAGKIQSIMDLSQSFPTLFSQEQIVDMLDLAADEKFKDGATIAVKSAESENESMLSGKPIEEPKAWEDLLVHYEVHLKALQSRQYKDLVPSEYQSALMEHIEITEMLIWKKCKENPVFMQKMIALFPQFPNFFYVDDEFRMLMKSGGIMPAPVEPAAAQLQLPQDEQV